MYKILADTKSYAEWSLTEDGELKFLEHQFEGHDVISYKIVDEDYPGNDPVVDGIATYERARRAIAGLCIQVGCNSKAMAIGGLCKDCIPF